MAAPSAAMTTESSGSRVSPSPLESERRRLHHIGQLAQRGKQLVGHRLVDAGEQDRLLAGLGAAEMEGGDVDAGIAQRLAEIADEARLVEIAQEQHVGRELG